jgi:NADH dehydrogenase [ubiquinone] 1 alpha subcomplex assembly factor 4
MGKVMSVISRQANRFNVENRAQKIISQDKPKPAPKFSQNIKDLERVLEDYPEVVEEQSKKHLKLDDNLKSVFVTSFDPNINVGY